MSDSPIKIFLPATRNTGSSNRRRQGTSLRQPSCLLAPLFVSVQVARVVAFPNRLYDWLRLVFAAQHSHMKPNGLAVNTDTLDRENLEKSSVDRLKDVELSFANCLV